MNPTAEVTAPAVYPFDRVRVRHFVWWLLGMLALSAVVLLAGAPLTVVMLVTPATLFAWLFWLRWRHGLELRRLLGTPPADPREWGALLLVPFVVAGSLGLFTVTTALLSYVAPGVVQKVLDTLQQGQSLDIGRMHGAVQITVVVIYLVALAPLSEELVFRGVLLHRWARRWGLGWGIALSSIAFCVLHPNVFGTLFLAVVLAAAYLRTRTLWVPMAIHASNNAIAVLGEAQRRATGGLGMQSGLSIPLLRGYLPRAALVVAIALPPAIAYVWLALRTRPALPYSAPEPAPTPEPGPDTAGSSPVAPQAPGEPPVSDPTRVG